jgi:hypothetical protein
MTTEVKFSSEAERLYSRIELALRWNCSKETIKRRERAGLLPALKFNSRVTRYRLSDIERIEYEAQNRFGSKNKEVAPCES